MQSLLFNSLNKFPIKMLNWMRGNVILNNYGNFLKHTNSSMSSFFKVIQWLSVENLTTKITFFYMANYCMKTFLVVVSLILHVLEHARDPRKYILRAPEIQVLILVVNTFDSGCKQMPTATRDKATWCQLPKHGKISPLLITWEFDFSVSMLGSEGEWKLFCEWYVAIIRLSPLTQISTGAAKLSYSTLMKLCLTIH